MFRTLALVALSGTFAASAAADVVNPLVPGWAGDPGTYTATFNNAAAPFTQPFYNGDDPSTQAPNVSDLGSMGPILYQFNNAFLTSTGNIYSFSDPLDVHVYGYGPVEQAVLNVTTLGNSIDFANVKMFVAGEDKSQYSSKTGVAQLQPPGAGETSAYEFDWSEISFEIETWGFFFGSSESSCSLTGVQVAINTVPAPGALLALGLVGITRRRRS